MVPLLPVSLSSPSLCHHRSLPRLQDCAVLRALLPQDPQDPPLGQFGLHQSRQCRAAPFQGQSQRICLLATGGHAFFSLQASLSALTANVGNADTWAHQAACRSSQGSSSCFFRLQNPQDTPTHPSYGRPSHEATARLAALPCPSGTSSHLRWPASCVAHDPPLECTCMRCGSDPKDLLRKDTCAVNAHLVGVPSPPRLVPTQQPTQTKGALRAKLEGRPREPLHEGLAATEENAKRKRDRDGKGKEVGQRKVQREPVLAGFSSGGLPERCSWSPDLRSGPLACLPVPVGELAGAGLDALCTPWWPGTVALGCVISGQGHCVQIPSLKESRVERGGAGVWRGVAPARSSLVVGSWLPPPLGCSRAKARRQ